MRLAVILFALGVVAVASEPSHAQEQTTQQIPVPQGKTSAQSFDKRWDVVFDSEVRYYTATTKGAAGGELSTRQTQIPFGLALSGRPSDDLKLEFGVRSGHVNVSQSSALIHSRYTGLTDTSVSGSATYNAITGFQPFVALSANLPTGRTNIGTTAGLAKPDPDVFQSPTFGEGTNIGPTVGVNIPLNQSTMVTLGIGHTVRGRFTRDGSNFLVGPGSGLTEVLDPGDVTTANASIGYVEGSLSLLGQLSYSWETVTSVDGAPFFKAGDRISVSGAVGYAWTEEWSSRLSASYSHFENNTTLVSPPVPPLFGLEQLNSNSNVTNVVFDTTYRSGPLAIGPTVGFMYRDHNGYDSFSLQFVPAKTKWSAGAVAQYAVTNELAFTLRAERVWVVVDATPDKVSPLVPFVLPGTATREINTDAWVLSFGGTIRF